jgi:hypothetical protein
MLDNTFNTPTPNFKNSLFCPSPKFTEAPTQQKTEEFHDNPQIHCLIQQWDFKLVLGLAALMLLAFSFSREPQHEFGIFLVSTILILVHISLYMYENKVWYGGFFVIVLSLLSVFMGAYFTLSTKLKHAVFITCHSFFHHAVALMIGKKKLHVVVSFSTVCILSFATLFLNFSLDWTMHRVLFLAAWFLLFPVIVNSVFASGNDVKLSLVRKRK